MDVTLGDVIAERSFINKDTGDEILLEFGKPERIPDHTGYYCPYKFTGVGHEKVRYACGVDAIQAIQLAFKNASYELEYYNREHVRIKWIAADDGDWGL